MPVSLLCCCIKPVCYCDEAKKKQDEGKIGLAAMDCKVVQLQLCHLDGLAAEKKCWKNTIFVSKALC